MGSGPARELQTGSGPLPKLDPSLASKLTTAVQRMDDIDPDFAQARIDERMGQLAKAWGAQTVDIEGYLRTLGHVLINSHQIALDMAVDGGGRGAVPWIEESSGKFERLEFRLDDDGVVHAVCGELRCGSFVAEELTYELVEAAVIEWIVQSIASLE